MFNKLRNNKILAIGLAVLLVAIAGGLYVYADRQSSITQTQEENSNTDYAPIETPPVGEKEDIEQPDEGEDGQDQDGDDEVTKEQPAQSGSNNDQDETLAQNVKPVITSARYSSSTLTVRAFADVDEKGQCVVEAKKGSTTKSKTVDSSFQSSYYQCENAMFTKSELGSTGTWNVVVKYQSSSYSGTSDPWEVEVN